MLNRGFVGAALLAIFSFSIATDAAADTASLSRAFQSGWDRYGTRLIADASDQESLSCDPDEDLRRAALPVDEPGALNVLDTECVACAPDLGACAGRSPPAA
jgi:hypothetical protein